MTQVVRVGVMPGRINEFAVEAGTSIKALLELAGLSASGYQVKVDGQDVTDLNGTVVTAGTALVMLTKQVKGNVDRTVRVGMMPGRINEFAVQDTTKISELLALAGLNPSGYTVKADGTDVTNLDQLVGSTALVMLTKQVKGNEGK